MDEMKRLKKKAGIFQIDFKKGRFSNGDLKEVVWSRRVQRKRQNTCLRKSCLKVFDIQREDKKEENDVAFSQLELRIVHRLSRQEL